MILHYRKLLVRVLSAPLHAALGIAVSRGTAWPSDHAGLGTSEPLPAPVFFFRDHTFTGNFSDAPNLDFFNDPSFSFQAGFSISFSVNWSNSETPSHILDLSDSTGTTFIIIGSQQRDGEDFFSFHVYAEDRWHMLDSRLHPTPGMHTYLCSMTKGAMMWCYMDEVLIGYSYNAFVLGKGAEMTNLTLGKAFWHLREGFQGYLKDLCIWDETVSVEAGSHCVEAGEDMRLPVLSLRTKACAGRKYDYADLEMGLGDAASFVNNGGFLFPHGISIGFTARWDTVDGNPHIVNFGRPDMMESIFITTYDSSESDESPDGSGVGLSFNIVRHGIETELLAPGAVSPGETHRYLCSISGSGELRCYRDGALIAFNRSTGIEMKDVWDFTNLYVGRSFNRSIPIFSGLVENLCVWDGRVYPRNDVWCDPRNFTAYDGTLIASDDWVAEAPALRAFKRNASIDEAQAWRRQQGYRLPYAG